jgi:hypothetical protein
MVSLLKTALSLVQRNCFVPAVVHVASRVVCHVPESCALGVYGYCIGAYNGIISGAA